MRAIPEELQWPGQNSVWACQAKAGNSLQVSE